MQPDLWIAVQERKPPQSHAQIVDYFMETEAGEMQFETSRLRPMLTDDFFKFLSTEISKLPAALGI